MTVRYAVDIMADVIEQIMERRDVAGTIGKTFLSLYFYHFTLLVSLEPLKRCSSTDALLMPKWREFKCRILNFRYETLHGDRAAILDGHE